MTSTPPHASSPLLSVPYVVHAVGPNYREYDADEEQLARGDRLLASAYARSLERGEAARLEAVAFCLLSAGIFRGPRSLAAVLRIGIQAIRDCGGYAGLKEVHVCGYTAEELTALTTVADGLGLRRIEDVGAKTASSANDASQESPPEQNQPKEPQRQNGGDAPPPRAKQEGEGDAREEWEVRRDDLKDAANAHFRAREYPAAIQAYEEALQLDPTNHILLSNKSAAHLANGEKSKALQDAKQCVAHAGSWAKGHTRLAAAMASLGRFHEAAGVYAKVLNELDPENPVAKKGLEDCRAKQRQAREAKEREARQLQAELDKQKAEREDDKEGEEEDDLMDEFFSEVEKVSNPKPSATDAKGGSEAEPSEKRIKIQLSDLGTSAAQIDRLLQLNYEWKNLNPFHVLDMPHHVNDEAVISTRYRALSLLVHPDKCPADPARAKAAFEEVRKAMAQLNDADKRRHARALVERGRKQGQREWEQERKATGKAGGGDGGEGLAWRQTKATMKIFAEIESKRRNIDERKRKYEQRERAQEDEEKGKEKKEREHDKRWRKGERVEQRVGSWRSFQKGGKK